MMGVMVAVLRGAVPLSYLDVALPYLDKMKPESSTSYFEEQMHLP